MSEHDEGRSARCSEESYANGLRNRYYLGKRMTPEAFRIEQEYQIERRRLINRSLHGWGVVEGFAVNLAQKGKLWVGPGVALDKYGRELVQVGGWTLAAEELLSKEDIVLAKALPGQNYMLSVHFEERREQKVSLNDPCHCSREEWEHAREATGYTLTVVAPGAGGQPAASRPLRAFPSETPAPAAGDRGPYRRLCEALSRHVSKAAPCGKPVQQGAAAQYEEVPLAIVTLKLLDNKLVFDKSIDACGARKLIIGNEMLYDLIRGRDLTRIAGVSWKQWHRKRSPIEWSEFRGKFHEDGCTDFTITFSGPVDATTVIADSFVMTIFRETDASEWHVPQRVPLMDPSYNADTNTATLRVPREWVRKKITENSPDFRCDPALVEIEVRGDFILDCWGQAIDANAFARCWPPTGNGSPGGNFLSTFRVKPRGGANH